MDTSNTAIAFVSDDLCGATDALFDAAIFRLDCGTVRIAVTLRGDALYISDAATSATTDDARRTGDGSTYYVLDLEPDWQADELYDELAHVVDRLRWVATPCWVGQA